MAQNLNIKINIKEVGLNIFDEILDKIAEVSKALQTTDFSALGALNKIGESLQSSFEDIKDSIVDVGKETEKVGEFIEDTVGAIVDNAMRTLTAGTQQGINTITKKIETSLARASLFFTGIVSVILAKTTNFFGVIDGALFTTSGQITKIKELSIKPVFKFLDLKILSIKDATLFFIKGLDKLSGNIFNILPAMEGMARLTGVLLVKALVVNTLVLSIFSGIKFFKRLIGIGMNAVSPLERITNLITTADKATGRLFLTWSHFFKLISFGALTAFAPLFGIFPLLNSIVDVVAIPLTNAMDKIGVKLGSSRSSFVVMLQTVRELFAVATPGIRAFVAGFAQVNKATAIADKGLKRIKGDTGALKSISNLKFPFMVQLQAFMAEARKFLGEIFKQIAQILLTIQNVFAVSSSEVNKTFTQATNLTKNLQRSVEKSSDEVFKQLDKKMFFLQKVFLGIIDTIKGAFVSTFNLAKNLLSGLTTIIVYPFNQIFNLLNGVFIAATFTIKTIFSFIKLFIPEVGDILKDLFVGIFQNFAGRFVQLFNLLKRGVTGFWNALLGGFSVLWSGIKKISTSILNIFAPKKAVATDPLAATQKKRAEEDKKSIKLAEETSKKYKAIKDKEIDASKKTVEQISKETKVTSELSTTKIKLGKIIDFSTLSKPLTNINKEFILMTGTFDRVGTSVAKIKNVLTPVKTLASIITFNLQTLNVVLQKTIFSLLNLEVASKRGLTNLLSQAGKLDGIINVFGIMAEQIAKGTKVHSNVERTMISLLKGLEQFSQKFGDVFAEDRFKKISVLFRKFIISGFKFDPKIITKAFINLEGEIKKLEEKGLIKGKDFGIKLKSMIGLGLKGGNKEIEKSLQALTELIASFFPQSPAKRGALIKLPQMGAKIVTYLVKGMLSKMSLVYKVAFKIANLIAKFFPRSLPVLGPLVSIVKSGALIPFYIAKGITQGVGSIVKAITGIAKTMLDTLKKATNLGFLAERIGVSVEKVSALENVLADVGATSSDLSFVFTRMRDTLNKTFSKEESNKIKALGINLQEIKRSGDPLINLFLQVSKVLKTVPISSKKAKDALELLGVTTHSKLINVLLKGNVEIKALMEQGVRLGTTYSSSFVKISQKITGMLNRLHRVKDFLVVDLIEGALPTLEKWLEKALKLVEKYRIDIQALLKIALTALFQVFSVLRALITFSVTQPDKMFSFIKNGVKSFYNFVVSLIGVLLTFLQGETVNFILKMGIILLKTPFIVIDRMFGGIYTSSSLWIYKIFLKILKTIAQFADDVIEYLYGVGKRATKSVLKAIYSAVLGFFNSLLGVFKYISKKAFNALVGSIKKIKKLQKGIKGDVTAVSTIKAMEKAIVKLEKTATPITTTIIEDLKKVSEEAATAIGENVNGVNKVMTESKKAFDSTRKSFLKLIDDLKKGAKFLPDEFGKEIARFEKILSKVNFDKIKLGLQKEKDLQVANIDAIDKKGTESKDKKIEDQKAIEAFLKEIQERITFNELSATDQRNQKATEKLEEAHLKELQSFQELTTNKENIDALFALQKVQMDKLASKQSTEVWLENLASMKTIASGLENMFQEMYTNSGEAIKEFFYASKVAAVAQATINIAQAITKAIAQGGILGIAQGAILSAVGGMQIGKIMAQTLSFNKGGEVPGEGNTDTISAKLTPGEYVIPKGAVQFYGANFLESIRQKMLPSNMLATVSSNLPAPYSPPRMAFATGGLVPDVPQTSEAKQQDINIVNVIDPNLLDKYLAGSTGQKQILNVLSANKYSVKRILQ